MKRMNKTWIISFSVIILAQSFIFKTNQSTRFQIQDNYEESATFAIFRNSQLPIPPKTQTQKNSKILGSSDASKKIYVDLTNQRLYAYEGDNLVYNFLVSTGKWGRTPTGVFTVWGKYRYIKMSGGSKLLHTYYYLPNVPYTMFFSNSQVAPSKGFALHGTYWHDNFGHPMSHGCVNMKTEEAEIIYHWSGPVISEGKNSARASKTNPGIEIIIYGITPIE